jgi:hypothetical protein
LTAIVPSPATGTAAKFAHVFVHGPAGDDAHSTWHVEPGKSPAAVSSPFLPKDWIDKSAAPPVPHATQTSAITKHREPRITRFMLALSV